MVSPLFGQIKALPSTEAGLADAPTLQVQHRARCVRLQARYVAIPAVFPKTFLGMQEQHGFTDIRDGRRSLIFG